MWKTLTGRAVQNHALNTGVVIDVPTANGEQRLCVIVLK